MKRSIGFIIQIVALCFLQVSSTRNCAYKVPSVLTSAVIESSIQEAEERAANLPFAQALCLQCIEIKVFFNIFKPSAAHESEMDADVVEEQMRVLNEGFKETPFTFRLIEPVRYHVNASYYEGMGTDEDTDIGEQFRQGDYSDLNVYFGGNSADIGSYGNPPLLLHTGESINKSDGCFVEITNAPNGTNSDSDEG